MISGPFHRLAYLSLGFLCLFAIFAPWSAATAAAPKAWAEVSPAPALTAAAAVLMDWETGQILYEKNGFVRRAPASTTKVLTAIVALERGRLDDQVTVSAAAAATHGSSMYLRVGEVLSLRDLLYGLLLNSGNDAAVAIAEHLAGSVPAFVYWMNDKAKAIGAANSHFVNPHGLNHPNHYSTARDLAVITRYAIQNPTFAGIVQRQEAGPELDDPGRNLRNTNRLLWMFEGADGVKTGTTSAAGACLVASATRADALAGQGHKLIAVVLNAQGRWHDSLRLLEWGYDQFRLAAVAQAGDVVGYLPVAGGRDAWLPVAAGAPVAAVVPRSFEAGPVFSVLVPPAVPAPVAAGQPVGTLTVSAGERTQAVVPLVAAAAVGRASWLTRLVRPLQPLLHRLHRWQLISMVRSAPAANF